MISIMCIDSHMIIHVDNHVQNHMKNFVTLMCINSHMIIHVKIMWTNSLVGTSYFHLLGASSHIELVFSFRE
jgi:hypothetical protein